MPFPDHCFTAIWTESFPVYKQSLRYCQYTEIRLQFCPYAGKCGSAKARILAYFTQCKILEKNLESSSFLSTVAGLQPATLLKKNSFTGIFQGCC